MFPVFKDNAPERLHSTQSSTNEFYNAVAERYHLFYRDWRAAVAREGGMLRRLLRGARHVLDASCGTGTQALALAAQRFEVTAVDPCDSMLAKAQANAREFKVADRIRFAQGDFLSLPQVVSGPFDAVITKGNSLPHLLTNDEIRAALRNFYDLLRPGGTVLIGMRDYDMLLEDRPRFVPRQAHLDDAERDEILFDIWDWNDGPPVTVTFNTFIVSGKGDNYTATRHPVTYRALTRAELETFMHEAGFTDLHTHPDVWELVMTGRKA